MILRGSAAKYAYKLRDGSALAPSYAFANTSTIGMYNAGFSPSNVVVSDTGVVVGGTVFPAPTKTFVVTNVQVTDSNYVALDDTSVNVNGGYVAITGTGFASGGMVLVDGVPALSTSYIGATRINARLPAASAGTRTLTVVAPNGRTATSSVSYSPFPAWSTGPNLGNVYSNVDFVIPVAATSDSNVSYANTTIMPANTVVTTVGNVVGNLFAAAETTFTFGIGATDQEFQNVSQTFQFTCLPPFPRTLVADSVQTAFGQFAAASTGSAVSGGTLIVDTQNLGLFEYTVLQGPIYVSSANASTWNSSVFSSVQDTKSIFVKVVGDLTIGPGAVVTPPVRKLFAAIEVSGNLVVSGTLSMTARGAAHSTVTANSITIAKGVYSGVTNPAVPAAGGGGAAGAVVSNGNADGAAGTSNSSGGTGGGGAGGARNNGYYTTYSGGGAAGTSFSGGSGGGGAWGGTTYANTTAGNGASNGGAGGYGAVSDGNATGQGGAGNPGGAASGRNAVAGSAGTGGILFVFAKTSIGGAGTVEAKGSKGGEYTGGDLYGTSGGGGSGGGSVTIMTKSGTVSVSAAGGAGGAYSGSCSSGYCQGGSGGAGGNGTARVLIM